MNRQITLTIGDKRYTAEIPDDPRFELHGCLWFFKTPSGTDYSINLGRSDWLTLVAAYAAQVWSIECRKWANLPVNDCKNFDAIAESATHAKDQVNAWQSIFFAALDSNNPTGGGK